MKSKLLLALGLLACGPLLAADFADRDLETAAQLREAALGGDGGYAIVADLTTRVGPRLAGSDGDARAVEWAVAKLEELGFDRVWTEPASFPAWLPKHERAAIVAPVPQSLVAVALGFSPATPDGGLEAEVVMLDDLEALQNVAPEAVRDRIIFVRNRMERTRTGAGYGRAVGVRSGGARIAAEKGAAALVIRSVGTSSNRFAHAGMQRYEPGVAMVPALAVSNPDADLIERLMALGEPVRMQLEVEAELIESYTSHNVIGEITGAERPEEIVALGAHLDSWHAATGALDDGAGVAIVTEAARMIGQLDQRPARSIHVILFAAEEIGLWGGRAWAEAHAAEIERYQLVAESDFGDGRIHTLAARVDDAAWPVIEAIHGVLEPLGVALGGRQAGGGPDFYPAQPLGVAAVDLHQDGTRYFDFHHTPNDTLDKIDAEAMKQNVAAYVVLAWLGAQSPVSFGSGATILDQEQQRAAAP